MYLSMIVDVNDKIHLKNNDLYVDCCVIVIITNLFANAMSALCKVCLKSYKKPSSVLIV